MQAPCLICQELTDKFCGACGVTAYCSVEHQRLDRNTHKLMCDARVPLVWQASSDMQYILKLFAYKIFTIKDLSEQVRRNVFETVRRSSTEACRWKISCSFVEEVLPTTDIVFAFQHPLNNEDREFWKDDKDETFVRYAAFMLVQRLPSSDNRSAAYIHLICSKQLGWDRWLKTNLGLILHGFALQYLSNIGIDDVYLEASNDELVPYYAWLGYESTGINCSVNPGFFKAVEEFFFGSSDRASVGKHGGWKMRMCNIKRSKIYSMLDSAIQTSAEELRNAVVDEETKAKLYDVA